MYTFDSRVRYSETTPDGFLRMESLIDYLQDCSTFQSEDLGIGIGYMKERHIAWVVNFWQIDVLRLPRLGERIVTGTSPYELRGFLGMRNFMVETESGERLVNANSVWSLLNLDRMAPERVTKEMQEGYELFPKFSMEYLPRKIAMPENMTPHESVEVTPQMLDSNHHVNNARYVGLGMEFVPEGKTIRRLCVEYRKQALEGDRILPCTAASESCVTVSLENGEHIPYAVLTFDYDKESTTC